MGRSNLPALENARRQSVPKLYCNQNLPVDEDNENKGNISACISVLKMYKIIVIVYLISSTKHVFLCFYISDLVVKYRRYNNPIFTCSSTRSGR
jgi:hypothetical protein